MSSLFHHTHLDNSRMYQKYVENMYIIWHQENEKCEKHTRDSILIQFYLQFRENLSGERWE